MINLKPAVYFIILLMVKKTTPVRHFSSYADLEVLLNTEEKVIKAIQKAVKFEMRKLDYLEKYLNRSKLEYQTAVKDVEYYFGNPINAYTIIKRLGPDLELAENILKNRTELKIPDAVFPTDEDLNEAMSGLLTMQVAYNLNVSQVANGILNGTASKSREVYTEFVSPMTSSDCYSIGMTLYSNKVYKDAIPWFEEAFKKMEQNNHYSTVIMVEVLDHLSQAYRYLEDWDNFRIWTQKRINLLPDDPMSEELGRYLDMLETEQSARSIRRSRKESSVNTLSREEGYWDICVGEAELTMNKSESLSCRYAFGPHPFLTLAPLKSEFLHRNPDVIMFHQLLSNDEMETLQQLSKPLMWNNTQSDSPDYTNSKFVKLEDNSSEVVARVSRRGLMLLDLISVDCEPLKIVSYGIGGSHWDTKREKSDDDWNRISILFYLSDVEQGGATVFPVLGLTVFPEKGAALFWRSQLPSGDYDLWTLHAACPVMRGAKWIAIKRPHQYKNKQCPVWTTEKGVVTEDVYKDILQDRQDQYTKINENYNHLAKEKEEFNWGQK